MNLKNLQNKFSLSDLELFTQNTSTHKLSFVANHLKQTESTNSSGQAVRLIKDRKVGFMASYGNQFSKTEGLEEIICQALEVSKFSSEIDISLPDKLQRSDLKANNTKENTLSKFKEKGSEIIQSILNKAPSVLVDVSFTLSSSKETLLSNRDLNYSFSNDTCTFLINIRETMENDFIDMYTGCIDNALPDHKEYLDELLCFYKLTKKRSKIKNGTWPIFFTSKAAKDLLNIVEIALNGKQVIQQSSPWHDKLGSQVLSKLISLKQNPDFGYMARSVDDEGNLVQPLVLVNNGVLENFYFDLITACRDMPRHVSTGNGFKISLSTQAEPTLLNMIVSCGKRSLNEIIKDIDYGLLVDQTMGSLNTNISGDMSVNVDVGFLIENGELVGRVKDTMITGNIYTALKKVIELSNNPRWHWSNIYNPDMLVSGFTVTSE